MMKSYIIAMVLSFFLITILNILLNKSSKKFKKKIAWQHYFFGYLFILYIMISLKEVVGFPSLSDWQRFLRVNQEIFNPNINLIPFRDGFEISDILNIIFFMPFGFLLPTLWQKYKKLLPTLFSGLVFSIIIEFAQLFANGRGTDINDLIMNTLGTICGWIIFTFMSKIFYKLANKTVVESSPNDGMIFKLEPYLYIFIAIISTFLS
ncbi:MAG: VanZ family protein [Clostridium septicum]|uniref:VanZ family protein n=1 Tax=Clostridium septicum TaxID=1504 RepID=UPI002583F600|nr:VanZ family protein [Clostridium septicum]MDU1314813.1 VanZ family protein [Clostridium septicum]